MSNQLVRSGYSYTLPGIAPRLPTPAYFYWVEEVVQAQTAGAAPAGWGYRQVTHTDGTTSIELTYLGYIPSPGYVVSPPIVPGTSTTRRWRRVDVAGDPGTPGTDSVSFADPPLGWTAFGRSIASIPGAGYGEFKVAANISGAVVGFASAVVPASGYGHIPHGLHFSGDVVRNARTGAGYGSYLPTDVFRITLNSTTVSFSKNGSPLASEASTYAPGARYLAATFYSPTDSIGDPLLVSGGGGSSAGAMTFHGLGADDDYAQSQGVFSFVGSAYQRNSSHGSFSFEGFGADRPYGESVGQIEFVGVAYGGMLGVVANSGSTGVMRFLGAALGKTGGTGGSNGVMSFSGMASDHAYGESIGSFSFFGTGFVLPENEVFLFDVFKPNPTIVGSLQIDGTFNTVIQVAGTLAAARMLEAAFFTLIQVNDTALANSVVNAVFNTLVRMDDTLTPLGALGDGETWVLNIDSGGSSQYTNYAFDSYARIGDRYFGASDEGLIELAGDDDLGDPIRAVVGLGRRNAGTANLSTWSQCLMGMSSTGNLFLKVIAGEQSYVYKVRNFYSELATQRVTLGKGLRTNYLDLEIYNEDGADFELDTVQFVVADLSRKTRSK